MPPLIGSRQENAAPQYLIWGSSKLYLVNFLNKVAIAPDPRLTQMQSACFAFEMPHERRSWIIIFYDFSNSEVIILIVFWF